MELLLDQSIRDWVLIPIMMIVFLTGMFRIVLSQITSTEKEQEKQDIFVSQTLSRTSKLKSSYRYISESAFKMRRAYFCKAQSGHLHKNIESNQLPFFLDPSSTLGMVKKNAAYGIVTMLTLSWISQFCSGFILAKVPFPLTQKFRSMLQRGVQLNALDVTYISSSSIYFIALFGMNGILGLIMDTRRDNISIQNMAMPMMSGGPGKDHNKTFANERQSLDAIKHKFALEGVEEYYLSKNN